MFATILGWLGNLIGGPFAKAAVDAYRAKLASDNTSRRLPPIWHRASSPSSSASVNWRRKW